MEEAKESASRRLTVLVIGLLVTLAVVGTVLVATRSPSGDATVSARLSSPGTFTASPSTVAASTTTSSPPTSTAAALPPATSSTTPVSSTSTSSTSPEATTTPPPAPPTTVIINRTPVWPTYETLPAVDGVAALTGESADELVTQRPILAVKIDNFRTARPQWGLDEADVVIEENVEGVTRFVGLFHSRLPDTVGPVRSARTGDLDLLAAMNRPILAWSGGNPGVTDWVRSAARSGLLIDFSAQHSRCFRRTSSRRSPHNLLLDPSCALENAATAGPARPLWETDADWTPPGTMTITPDTTFDVEMDGIRVGWTWDAASETYLRSQDGRAHTAVSGERISANNVVELFSFHAPSPVDGRSPNPITVGGTDAIIHRDGIAIQGSWYRETAYESFRFFDAATGDLIPLDTGTTFIELVRDR